MLHLVTSRPRKRHWLLVDSQHTQRSGLKKGERRNVSTRKTLSHKGKETERRGMARRKKEGKGGQLKRGKGLDQRVKISRVLCIQCTEHCRNVGFC